VGGGGVANTWFRALLFAWGGLERGVHGHGRVADMVVCGSLGCTIFASPCPEHTERETNKFLATNLHAPVCVGARRKGVFITSMQVYRCTQRGRQINCLLPTFGIGALGCSF